MSCICGSCVVMQAMPSAEPRAVAELNLAAAPLPVEVFDAAAPRLGEDGHSSEDDAAAAVAPSHLGPDLEHVARMLSDAAVAPGSPSPQHGRPRLKRGRREPAGSRSAGELQELAGDEAPTQHTGGDARGDLRLARAPLRRRRRQRRRADSTDGRIQAVDSAVEPRGRAWNRPGEHSSATARACLTLGVAGPCSAALQWFSMCSPWDPLSSQLRVCAATATEGPVQVATRPCLRTRCKAAGSLAEHLLGHTAALSQQAWRCEACECWVPRAAGGETAWRAHVQGIRHRRQALSLLHTGARGNLLLSAFERLPGACLVALHSTSSTVARLRTVRVWQLGCPVVLRTDGGDERFSTLAYSRQHSLSCVFVHGKGSAKAVHVGQQSALALA